VNPTVDPISPTGIMGSRLRRRRPAAMGDRGAGSHQGFYGCRGPQPKGSIRNACLCRGSGEDPGATDIRYLPQGRTRHIEFPTRELPRLGTTRRLIRTYCRCGLAVLSPTWLSLAGQRSTGSSGRPRLPDATERSPHPHAPARTVARGKPAAVDASPRDCSTDSLYHCPAPAAASTLPAWHRLRQVDLAAAPQSAIDPRQFPCKR
jgi:hypothetical protein